MDGEPSEPETGKQDEVAQNANTEVTEAGKAEREQAATAIQSAVRSRATRKTKAGQRAAERAEQKRKQIEAEQARLAAEKEAERLADRQRLAEDKYAEADVDGDETVSRSELGTLILSLLTEQGLTLAQAAVDEFVERQFAKADVDDDGTVSFDEFCAYYNELVDTLEGDTGRTLVQGLKDRSDEVTTEEAHAEAVRTRAGDVRDMDALMRLVAVLTHPSVAPVSGTQLLFERGGDGDLRPQVPPSEEEVRTTAGLVLDMGRHGQRLITPWGSYVISYTLTFEGYNEDQVRAAAEEQALSKLNTESFYFVLCRIGSKTLSLHKLPGRARFAIRHVAGVMCPLGEVVGETGDLVDAAEAEALRARFQEAVSAAETPALDFGRFLINDILGRTVVIDDKLMPILEERLKKSKTRPRTQVLRTALELADNDVDEAYRLRQEHLKAVDKLVSQRKGYSTRDHCDNVLTLCRWDLDTALFVLNNEPQFEATVAEVSSRRGLTSGLGFPSREEVAWEVASARNDQAAAIRAIMRQWHIEVRMMRDIVGAAAVDAIAQRNVELERPGRRHVEALLDKHGGDVAYVEHLLEDAAFILREGKDLGGPSRERVEELVEHFAFNEHKVRAFLKSIEYIFKSRRQVGSPTRAEIEHYLEKFDYDQKAAIKYMKLVYKYLDPKPPKDRHVVPKKVEGRLIKHIAHDCELLHKGAVEPWARRSVEVALEATKSVETGEPIEDDAIAFLLKVSKLHKEAPHLPRWELEWAVARSYAEDRDDGKVTIDETMAQWRRFDAFVREVQQSYDAPDRRRVCALLEELGTDEAAVRARLAAVHELTKVNDALGEGLSLPQLEALLEKHQQSLDRTRLYLTGMHTLREHAQDLGSPPSRALQAALELHGLDVAVALKHLSASHALLSDRDFLADAGQPNASDVERALTRLDYDSASAKTMLLQVFKLKVESDQWGAPSREECERVLIDEGLDRDKAKAALKEAHRKDRISAFKEQQSERKAKEEADRIILADKPGEEEQRLASEAEARQLAEEAKAQRVRDAARADAELEAEAKAAKATKDDARRQKMLASIDGPKPNAKQSRTHTAQAGGNPKDANESNQARLEKIAALQAKLDN